MIGALQKAYIEAGPPDRRRLTCRFNPTEYSITKSASWSQAPTQSAEQAPQPQFLGTNPRSLQMELFFDGWDSNSGDVRRDIETLIDWTKPTRQSANTQRPVPSVLVFHWGQTASFEAYLSSVNVRYTMFGQDGKPLRATANVTLEETPPPPSRQRQNPTSGSVAGRRTHVVTAGDSLHSIAYREYGDATAWRRIAEANAIDDPLSVSAGMRILVPRLEG